MATEDHDRRDTVRGQVNNERGTRKERADVERVKLRSGCSTKVQGAFSASAFDAAVGGETDSQCGKEEEEEIVTDSKLGSLAIWACSPPFRTATLKSKAQVEQREA